MSDGQHQEPSFAETAKAGLTLVGVVGAFMLALFMCTGAKVGAPVSGDGGRSTQSELSEKRLIMARVAISQVVRDGDSVKFRNEASIGPNLNICGEFNAKNGFGGYAGWQGYVFSDTGLEIEEGNKAFAKARKTKCAGQVFQTFTPHL